MGMFSTLGGAFFGPIGTGIGGLIDSRQASKRSDKLSGDVNALGEQQYQRTLPWDVSGEFGDIKYDRDGKAISSSLSAPWQSQMDALLGQSTDLQSQIAASSDPIAYGQQLAQQQKDAVAGNRRRAMLSREARNIAQGTEDSMSNIYKEMGAGATIAQQDAGYDRQGFANALKMGDSLRDWQAQALKGAADIGKLPNDYRQLALSGAVSTDPYSKQRVEGLEGASKAKGMMYDKFGNIIKSSGMFSGSLFGDSTSNLGNLNRPGWLGGNQYGDVGGVGYENPNYSSYF